MTFDASNAKQKRIDLNCHFDEKIPEILIGDPVKLKQVLFNIVGNAFKFTEKGSITINISIEKETERDIQLLFSIKDTGIGISEEKKELIFKAFTQEDGSYTRKFGGTGLGLTISRNIVQLMGGEIWVESQKGIGSNFLFTSVFGKHLDYTNKEKGKEENNNSKVKFEKLKLLVVEDNEVNQMMFIKAVQKYGWSIEIASNGMSAINTYIRNGGNYDAIVMDIQLPEMDGIEVTQKIMVTDVYKNKKIPIIAVTAYAMSTDRGKFIDAGFNDYISKPIKFENFSEVVERNVANFIKIK